MKLSVPVAFALVVSLSACGHAGSPHDRPGEAGCPELALLDLAGLDSGEQGAALPEELVSALSLDGETGTVVGAAAAVGGGAWLVVTTACAAPTPDDPPESCTGTLTLLGADGARRAQAELFEAPGHVLECEDLAVVLALDVLDLDGDDRDEAVIRWEETGEPQPAVGSQRTEHVAIVALPTLAWLWEEQVGAHGAGGQDSCEYTLVARPAGCTGRRELAFERDCMTAVCRPEDDEDDPDGDGIADAWCPEKEPPVVTRGVYRANPTTRRFEAR